MRLLNDAKDINALMSAVNKCKGDVLLKSLDGREEFNLKSTLSEYIAIGELCKEHGDEWEIFCMDKHDEGYLMNFFMEIKA